MFTTYFAIWKALPKEWKTEIENSERDYNINFPANIALIIKDKKDTSSIRNIWTHASNIIPPTAQHKWDLEYGVNGWKFLYQLSHKCKFNARIIYFQYQILHRSLVTDKKLEHVMSVVQLKLFLTYYSTVRKDRIFGSMQVTGLEEQPIKIPVWMKNQLY